METFSFREQRIPNAHRRLTVIRREPTHIELNNAQPSLAPRNTFEQTKTDTKLDTGKPAKLATRLATGKHEAGKHDAE